MTEQPTAQPEAQASTAGEATPSPAVVALVAALASVLLRLPFVSRMPLTWDGVQYVLGVLHFDLAMHEPHPPGYFLYVRSARLLHLAGMSPHAALLTVTLLATAIMALVVVWWAGRMGGRRAALAGAALCVFSPLVWSASTDPNTYAVAGMASAVVGWLSWRSWREGGWWTVVSGAALGLAAGLRPTTALFLLPLWAWCAFSSPNVKGQRIGWSLAGVGALVISALAWALPFLAVVGGLAEYREISGRLAGGMMLLAPIAGNLGRLGAHLGTMLTGAVSLLLLGWVFAPRAGGSELTAARSFVILWLGPALAFFLLVHMAKPQYLMVVAPAALLIGAIGLGRTLGDMSAPWRRAALLVSLIVVNGVFIWFSSVQPQRATQQQLERIAEGCEPYATSGTVAITSIASVTHPAPRGMWLPYRTAMYLLPDVTVSVFPLERTGPTGTMPNAGRGWKSEALVPPASFAGITQLLLLGEGMADYLPEGVEARPVVEAGGIRVLVVPLAPDAPLVLEAGGSISLTPAD